MFYIQRNQLSQTISHTALVLLVQGHRQVVTRQCIFTADDGQCQNTFWRN